MDSKGFHITIPMVHLISLFLGIVLYYKMAWSQERDQHISVYVMGFLNMIWLKLIWFVKGTAYAWSSPRSYMTSSFNVIQLFLNIAWPWNKKKYPRDKGKKVNNNNTMST